MFYIQSKLEFLRDLISCGKIFRMEGKGEYSFPNSLETKYIGDLKDGM